MSQPPPLAAVNSRCAKCGAEFRCGMEGGDPECWCASLPPLMLLPVVAESGAAAGSCFCPACLQALLEAPKADSPPRVHPGASR
jgi:hypothetical protein